jgi:hypothetical protein
MRGVQRGIGDAGFVRDEEIFVIAHGLSSGVPITFFSAAVVPSRQQAATGTLDPSNCAVNSRPALRRGPALSSVQGRSRDG